MALFLNFQRMQFNLNCYTETICPYFLKTTLTCFRTLGILSGNNTSFIYIASYL